MTYDLRWWPARRKRRLLKPPLTRLGGRNERKRLLRRNGKSMSPAESRDMMPGIGWRRKELSGKNTIMSEGPLGPVLTPLLTPWDGVSMNGPGKRHMRVPHGLGTWSAGPMDHQQLAARMVCSWGLIKAYQRTRQSTYVCPPAPHVIEAFNHNLIPYDSHKELGTQEHVVLQYACALQYVSFCNDERYKDHLAPVVKAFWSEVAEPFGSRALHNLDLSHILGKAMCPNRGAKIPDYGVWDHIAQVYTPFFQGIESWSKYESRQH